MFGLIKCLVVVGNWVNCFWVCFWIVSMLVFIGWVFLLIIGICSGWVIKLVRVSWLNVESGLMLVIVSGVVSFLLVRVIMLVKVVLEWGWKRW